MGQWVMGQFQWPIACSDKLLPSVEVSMITTITRYHFVIIEFRPWDWRSETIDNVTTFLHCCQFDAFCRRRVYPLFDVMSIITLSVFLDVYRQWWVLPGLWYKDFRLVLCDQSILQLALLYFSQNTRRRMNFMQHRRVRSVLLVPVHMHC